MIYQSQFDQSIVEANQVQEGHRETLWDLEGNRIVAEGGDYVIVYPYTEVVDPESFEREYEELDA